MNRLIIITMLLLATSSIMDIVATYPLLKAALAGQPCRVAK